MQIQPEDVKTRVVLTSFLATFKACVAKPVRMEVLDSKDVDSMDFGNVLLNFVFFTKLGPEFLPGGPTLR